MKAIRVHQAGGPEVLQIEELPRPLPRPGWVLIRVKAFGLNRSLQHIVEGIEQKRYDTHIDRIFPFHQIVEAHRYMEENRATGKLVVSVDL